MDTARFLALRSEDGYVDSPARAMRGEPEAPSEADQQAITDTVYARERSARIASRTATTAEIERELTHIEARGRYLRRQLKRLQRPL